MLFWKIYFWVLTVLLAAYHLSLGFPRIWEALDCVINIGIVIGVFGFCWKRRIFINYFGRYFSYSI